MTGGSDPWDDVWDAYEARQAPPAPAVMASASGGAPNRRGWLRAIAMTAVFGLGCAAGSAWPLMSLYALVLRQDAPALLRQLDLAPAREGLRLALRDHAGLSARAPAGGMERLLAGMADEMADALARPGALRQVMLARQETSWPRRDPAAPPLQRLRPAGWGGTSLEWGPAEGQGGFGLDLVRGPEGWRVAAVRLLDAPVTGDAPHPPLSHRRVALGSPPRPG
ncbi:hypothetical protein [Roseomonas marmotae]|uniref:DUF2939 domain-containing protein n=1 Tax=Roseomonas marmotae TaxID=2768161 RepID=A0ABS3K6V9_9PROT|nr:hypothetical protein [Roseomonas marmotae]MBO1073170.1 hypothetical protein [Roseomonas marmotae]QTI79196.1 hypothetical protein IAI58_16495 [Roseomonas marmotae]